MNKMSSKSAIPIPYSQTNPNVAALPNTQFKLTLLLRDLRSEGNLLADFVTGRVRV